MIYKDKAMQMKPSLGIVLVYDAVIRLSQWVLVPGA
jgi:hypothetical protein